MKNNKNNTKNIFNEVFTNSNAISYKLNTNCSKNTSMHNFSKFNKFSIVNIVILTILLIIQQAKTQFNQVNTCQFTSSDGYTYDISNMRKAAIDYKYDYMKYSYRANFCGPLITTCNASEAPAGLFLRRGVCVGKFTRTWSNMGIKAEYLDNDIKTNGIRLSFESGERCISSFGQQFSLNYTIKCDPSQISKLETVRKVTACNYDFVFSSKYGCPTSFISSNSNSKSILFYLSLVFCIYLVGFTYINYRNNPEDGLVKALPHRDFWREFAEYAVDGYRFSLDFTKSKVEYYYEKYKERKGGDY